MTSPLLCPARLREKKGARTCPGRRRRFGFLSAENQKRKPRGLPHAVSDGAFAALWVGVHLVGGSAIPKRWMRLTFPLHKLIPISPTAKHHIPQGYIISAGNIICRRQTSLPPTAASGGRECIISKDRPLPSRPSHGARERVWKRKETWRLDRPEVFHRNLPGTETKNTQRLFLQSLRFYFVASLGARHVGATYIIV